MAEILAEGSLCVKLVQTSQQSLVSILLEGPPNSGKTALAAQIAKNSNFPFIKICTPEDMVDFIESAKRHSVQKV